ncbi:alpha/beta hydrolase family protein [Pedobacter sp.]|uniref:alpha/beta hydrolase family protein n=1 Tax=Pedobacter sp. TaxID=1411316 RepID=UPI00396CCFC5
MKINLTLFLLFVSLFTFGQKAEVKFLPDLPYDKYELKKEHDTITFYLSVTSSKEELPLIVFVQGSGMNSLFFKNRNGQFRSDYGHMTWFDVAQEKYRVLIVEKPGVKFLQTGESTAFDQQFSLDNWSSNIATAIHYTLEHQKILKNKVLIAGHSEGGVVAARVAKMLNNKISNVAILAGEGPSQLYSLYKFADEGIFFNTKEHNMPTSAERISYVENKWKAILADPLNTEKKFWGFTYLRWSSMLKTSVIDELSDFKGKILLIQGTADKNVYPESAIIAYTTLLSKGREIKLEKIENADHSFNLQNNPKVDGWKMVIQKAVDWFKNE